MEIEIIQTRHYSNSFHSAILHYARVTHNGKTIQDWFRSDQLNEKTLLTLFNW